MDVQEKFMSFARIVMLYEKEKIKKWESKANSVCMTHLKQSILKKDSASDIRISLFFQFLSWRVSQARFESTLLMSCEL